MYLKMNKVIIGIDVGGSTTKIVGIKDNEIISPLKVRATDPITSTFGAFGRFISENSFALSDIEKIMITGVGSSHIKEKIYGIGTAKADEFLAIGLGGQMLTSKLNAIIISMGTGTAIIRADGDSITHMGGTGVGGGTLLGLSQIMLNIRDFDHVMELAAQGDLSHVDLTVGDISKKTVSMLPPETTASNFGKLHELATKSDIALGIVNMIFQSIGMLAVFACKVDNLNSVILTGNLTVIPQAKQILKTMHEIFKIDFIIPQYAEYSTALGAAKAFFTGKDFEEL